MWVDVPKLGEVSLPGSSWSLTSPGVVEGGLPLSLLVGSPEYSSHRTVAGVVSWSGDAADLSGNFQNFFVFFLGIGRLLLYLLPDVFIEDGDRLAKGFGFSVDIGEMLMLLFLL